MEDCGCGCGCGCASWRGGLGARLTPTQTLPQRGTEKLNDQARRSCRAARTSAGMLMARYVSRLVNTSTRRAPTRTSSPWRASMARVSDLPPSHSGVMLKVTSSLALDHGWPASVLPANKQQGHTRTAAERENLFLSLCLRASVFCSSAPARCHSPARLFAPNDSRR